MHYPDLSSRLRAEKQKALETGRRRTVWYRGQIVARIEIAYVSLRDGIQTCLNDSGSPELGVVAFVYLRPEIANVIDLPWTD